MGAVGVTGTGAANTLAAQADVIVGVGTRFADFTTGSWALFKNPDRRFIGAQRAAVRCGQASRAACRRRRPHGARRARFRARRVEGAALVERRRRQGQGGMGGDGRRAIPRRPTRRRRPTPKCSARSCARARRATSSSAPPAVCRASCTSCGGPGRRSATISNTAIPAWATRSPAGSASRWRCRSARWWSSSATALIS